jgi:hypothetical protein
MCWVLLQVGQSVYAIGNPSGLSKTLTAGVVSGLNRTIPAPTGTRIYGAIQVKLEVMRDVSAGLTRRAPKQSCLRVTDRHAVLTWEIGYTLEGGGFISRPPRLAAVGHHLGSHWHTHLWGCTGVA